MPGPAGAFVGMCIRVISPTPSKNVLRFSGVVLKDMLPTQTEFCRLPELVGTAVPSLSLRFFAADSSRRSRFSFFFCLRRSAWERTGTSGNGSASESSFALSESESESESVSELAVTTSFLFLLSGAGDGGSGLALLVDAADDEELIV